jgi:hypothetical protein
MYIHKHPAEKCTVNRPDDNLKMLASMQDYAKKAGIKILGNYVAPHEHTMYLILEASDLAALEKGMVPLMLMGDAQLIPILTVEQAANIGR